MLSGGVFLLMLLPGPPGGLDQAASRATTVSLDQAVAEALSSNLDLLAERARLPISDARRRTAGLRPNPELAFSADHLDLAGTRFTEENGGGPAEYSLRTDYRWELAGKRRRRVEVADREGAVVRHEIADQARRLGLEARGAFVDLLLSQRLVALAEESLGAMRRVEGLNEARVRSGDLAEVELMRTRVAVLQQENEVRRRDLGRRAAQRRLALLMGRAGDAGRLEAAGEIDDRDRAPVAEADLERAALGQRSDLLAMAADADRAQAEARLQAAIGRADVTVGAEVRRQQGVNGRANSIGLFVGVPLPVFDRNQGERARAGAEAELAARRLASLRASIAVEVSEACDRHETARATLERIEREMLADARQVRTITEYAYERGEASLVEWLDAQRAFNETMQGHLEAQAEFVKSRFLIDAVSGKGEVR